MLRKTDNRPSRWPSVSGLILASGFLLLGLARPVYGATFSILVVSFALAVLFWRPHNKSSPSRSQQDPATTRSIQIGLLCYGGFVLILITQVAASIIELAADRSLTMVGFSSYNLDLNIFIPICNLLLIFAGYNTLSRTSYIDKFLNTYFFAICYIWHLAFLTWIIDSNAVLFYYSEWSRGTFSGPIVNANHAAVVTLLIFTFFSLRCRDSICDAKENSSPYSARPIRLLFSGSQAVIFFYYTVQANSTMVNATLFAVATLLLAFFLFSRWVRPLYLASSAAFLGIALAYVMALVMLDSTQIPLSGFEARQIIGREALHLIMERPVLGYGTGSGYLVLLGRSLEAIPELIFQSAHSYYLDFLLQYGVAGFWLAFTGMFVVPMSIWILNVRRDRLMSSTAFLIWIIWLVLLLTALTDFALSNPSVSMLLCFLTGGIYRQFADRHLDTKPSPHPTTAAEEL